jgi:hypothetical protein
MGTMTTMPIVLVIFSSKERAVCRRLLFIAIAGALWLLEAGAPAAEAAGYWNVPGNMWQWAGSGCGGGYHAPLVLGPMSWHGWCAKNHYRLPHAPGPCFGCGHCGGFEQPTMIEPAPQPVVAPIAPVSRTHRPLFLR